MKALQRAFAPLQRRIMLMVGRAVLELVNDATKMQSAQVSLLDDELRESVERFQNYGFTSVPEAGAEGVALSVQGDRDHVILVAVDDRRYRKLGMLPGEVAVYTKWGDFIHLKQAEIVVQHATKIRLVAPTTEVEGNMLVHGNVTADGNVADQGGAKTMAGMRTVFNNHTQPVAGGGGGTAQAPSGGM